MAPRGRGDRAGWSVGLQSEGVRMTTNRIESAIGGLAAVALALATAVTGGAAVAQEAPQRFIPGIWIDPDGCEHWAMDDGTEGYMSPHRTRDGRPVCHRSEICGVMPTDQLFPTDRYDISAENRARLQSFFQTADAFGFLVYGHTDGRASDEYNIALSNNRAGAVAQVALASGVRVIDVQGYGERQPVASNATPEGMQANRRVEIYCLR